MPHDKNGFEVKVGDRVLMEFEVMEVQKGEEYCNVRLESVIPLFPGEHKTHLAAVNTRQVEKK